MSIHRARAELASLVGAVEDGEPVEITRGGVPVVAMLPIAAVKVWQAHQVAESRRLHRVAEEQALGTTLPTGRTAVCPHCRGSYLHVLYSGEVVALVNTADPDAGVQAVVLDTAAGLDPRHEVWCASCGEPMGQRPRQHGHPAHREALEIVERGPWPGQGLWEVEALHGPAGDTRAERIVVAHDIARGRTVLVPRWEWLNDVLNLARGRPRTERRRVSRDDECD